MQSIVRSKHHTFLFTGKPLSNASVTYLSPSFGLLLSVAYDGTAFHGWASQRGVRTVEETLRGAVLAMDPRVDRLRGTSRTDAGVHAEEQYVAFDSFRELDPRAWVMGLNQHLPSDLAVRTACRVPAGFHPRFAARSKRYCYRIAIDPLRHPFYHHRAWRIDHTLNLEQMQREAESAEGEHDFSAFRSSQDRRESAQRRLHKVEITQVSSSLLNLVVAGDAFLHNMVRILVGTMVDVGRGRCRPGAIARALTSGDRRDAGITAPAHGLTLESIDLALPEERSDFWPP